MWRAMNLNHSVCDASDRRPDQIAAHEPDAITHASLAELPVEEPVDLLVLGERPLRRVRLVEHRHPKAVSGSVLHEAGKHAGEAVHVLHDEVERAPLPRDVDLRIRAVRERDRSDERVHAVRECPLGLIEEDPDELRLEREHLRLERTEPRWRPS